MNEVNERFFKKAQFSLEYLFVIGFAMTIVLITAYAFFIQSKESTEDQQLATIDFIAHDMLSNVENVYYAVALSKKTLRYTMPQMLNNISVTGDDAIVFSITKQGVTSELSYYSDVPIEGYFPHDPGYTQQITNILVYNNDTYVMLCTEEFGCG
ncbi:hypothetical protein HZA99_06105 [Candidatus Woesearchaeota archaeon]|nr:hypothetical protein [Candidatus Woesearchaeota archaeon]